MVAPRKYGKTSLALEILRQLKKENYYVGEIDFSDIVTKKELAEKVLKHALKIVRQS